MAMAVYAFWAFKSSHFITIEISGAAPGIFSYNVDHRNSIVFIDSKVLDEKKRKTICGEISVINYPNN